MPEDWRERFIAAYDTEFQEWIDGVRDGGTYGPSSWDGYAAAVVSDAAVEALHSGERVAVKLVDKPALYALAGAVIDSPAARRSLAPGRRWLLARRPRAELRRPIADDEGHLPMVKIALDPAMYHADLSVADEVRKAADLGYEYLELSPRADFFFWHRYPKADDAAIAEVKKACQETGVTLLTLVPVFNWSSPDEQERQAQVRNWRRLLQIAAELECPLVNSELSGDPNDPVRSEHAFYKSMEELIPDFEKYGIALNLEAHPYDFSETNDDAVQIIRGLNKPWVNYVFCAPHAFHLSDGQGDLRRMMDYAGDKLAHLHVADCYNHRANVGNRYIINPPGVDARIHQHNEIGNGDVDWDEFFATLREKNFDGIATVCVFGWEETADDIHRRMLERVTHRARGLRVSGREVMPWRAASAEPNEARVATEPGRGGDRRRGTERRGVGLGSRAGRGRCGFGHLPAAVGSGSRTDRRCCRACIDVRRVRRLHEWVRDAPQCRACTSPGTSTCPRAHRCSPPGRAPSRSCRAAGRRITAACSPTPRTTRRTPWSDPLIGNQANFVLHRPRRRHIRRSTCTCPASMRRSSARPGPAKPSRRANFSAAAARTGLTGCRPHLHFQVQPSVRADWFTDSIPMRFVDRDVVGRTSDGVPVEGEDYISDNAPR